MPCVYSILLYRYCVYIYTHTHTQLVLFLEDLKLFECDLLALSMLSGQIDGLKHQP